VSRSNKTPLSFGKAAFLFVERLSGQGLLSPIAALNIVIRRSVASLSGAYIPLECIADSRPSASQTIISRSETCR
jgi:hypothetical protein